MAIPPPEAWPSLPWTRDEAKRIGSKHYWTGVPCRREHVEPWLTSDGTCTACVREGRRRRRAERWAEIGTEAEYEERVVRNRSFPSRAAEAERARGKTMREQGITKDQQRRTMTPPWLSDEDRAAVSTFVRNRPQGMEVDHRVPFGHQEVAGLHVLDNLQYLTPRANRRKGNRLPEGMTPLQAVESGLAVWRRDVDFATGQVNWMKYRA